MHAAEEDVEKEEDEGEKGLVVVKTGGGEVEEEEEKKVEGGIVLIGERAWNGDAKAEEGGVVGDKGLGEKGDVRDGRRVKEDVDSEDSGITNVGNGETE